MALVLLIYGEPGNGKSFLADKLQTEYSFAVLGIDEEYVAFIQQACPELYFERLEYYIGPHYHCIINDRNYSMTHLGRDYVGEWHSHLQNRVQEQSALHERLAVEGGLLIDCMDLLEAALKPSVKVVRIEVKGRRYFRQGVPITTEQIVGQ